MKTPVVGTFPHRYEILFAARGPRQPTIPHTVSNNFEKGWKVSNMNLNQTQTV